MGEIPVISSDLTLYDKIGTLKVRCNIGRATYFVDPGLYAFGNPDSHSHVIVTANYKLTFDTLRRELTGLNVWILVLDTNGVNVWCAAGKGTFGTDELVRRIGSSGLSVVVAHRRLILPQLSAPGIEFWRVKQLSGFSVVYGPVRADDLPYFIQSGLKAETGMRRLRFTLADRAVLIPVELIHAVPALMVSILFFTALTGMFGVSGSFWENVNRYGFAISGSLVFSFLVGTVAGPLMLPWLPGRAFAVKGFCLGVITSVFFFGTFRFAMMPSVSQLAAISALAIAIIMFYLVNFTGCTTFTSLSGVKKEMRLAVPIEIALLCLGTGLWVYSLRNI